MKNKLLVWSGIIVLVSFLLAAAGCECGTAITITLENQTDRVLTIHIPSQSNPEDIEHSWKVGDVGPGQQISFGADLNSAKWYVVALNSQGEMVFSQVYSLATNLKKQKGNTYKGVIPPLEQKP